MVELNTAEIIRSYKSADNKKQHIRILSELNGCSASLIIQILKDSGVDVPFANNADSKLHNHISSEVVYVPQIAYKSNSECKISAYDKGLIYTHLEVLRNIRDRIDHQINSLEQILKPDNNFNLKLEKLNRLIRILSHTFRNIQINPDEVLNKITEREIDFYICKISALYK